jgi:hypothetical protein
MLCFWTCTAKLTQAVYPLSCFGWTICCRLSNNLYEFPYGGRWQYLHHVPLSCRWQLGAWGIIRPPCDWGTYIRWPGPPGRRSCYCTTVSHETVKCGHEFYCTWNQDRLLSKASSNSLEWLNDHIRVCMRGWQPCFVKQIVVAKSKEVKTGSNLSKFSKEGYG